MGESWYEPPKRYTEKEKRDAYAVCNRVVAFVSCVRRVVRKLMVVGQRNMVLVVTRLSI